MNRKGILYLFLPLLMGLIACESDTGAWEAELEKAWIIGRQDTVEVTATEFYLYVPMGEEVKNERLGFSISKRASSSSVAGELSLGDTPLSITVVSENGEVERTYRADYMYYPTSYRFDFENWVPAHSEEGSFLVPSGGWTCGNDGIDMLKAFNSTSEIPYPTMRTNHAHTGKAAVQLQTVKTPNESAPLAAGSLFLGNFNISNALKNPKHCLEMGYGYSREKGFPLRLEGWFSYQQGNGRLVDEGGLLGEDGDRCNIYAVLYTGQRLNAENIFASDRILAIAKYTQAKDKEGYEHFSIPFRYRNLPEELPANTMLTIMFSSSYLGQDYAGRVGAKLLIDDVSLVGGKRSDIEQ